MSIEIIHNGPVLVYETEGGETTVKTDKDGDLEIVQGTNTAWIDADALPYLVVFLQDHLNSIEK